MFIRGVGWVAVCNVQGFASLYVVYLGLFLGNAFCYIPSKDSRYFQLI